MNLLHTPIGGFKLYLDDIDYLQDNVKSILDAHISRLTQSRQNFIYSGCDIVFDSVNSTISCSSGWVVVDGELLKFEPQTVSPSTYEVNFRFVLDESDDPNGVKVNDDGITFFAYKKRKAVLEYVASPDNSVDSYFSFDNELNRIWTYSDVVKGKTIDLDMESGWAFSSSLSYRKDIDGLIHISGNSVHTSSVSSGQMATLPTGFRPVNLVRGIFVTSSGVVPCFVHPTGIINFLSSAFENGHVIIPPFKSA